ncbi:MAG: NUDIX hydrolase [Chloroflexota bacterium]|nr:NUDIX hydrolase [Chloroflexota bacterium]
MPILRTARATSAGGVVHRTKDGRTQVALVHRRAPVLWALPKGTPDSGETIEETALRETREETGLEVEIVQPLRSIRYFFVRGSTRFHKTVHFFLMRAVGGSTDAHDAEFDDVRWVDLPEALALLNHATERSVVEEAAAALDARADQGSIASAEASA